jgi:hypothetical protein
MNNRSSIHFCIAASAFLALNALAFAAAQQSPQGQYHLSYAPLPQNAPSTGSLATYSPIKFVDGKTIQLRGDDGVPYIFMLTPETVYCQGSNKVSDWTFLKNVPKKVSITVVTTDETNLKAVVIWDQPPSITTTDGQLSFSLPPMCK